MSALVRKKLGHFGDPFAAFRSPGDLHFRSPQEIPGGSLVDGEQGRSPRGQICPVHQELADLLARSKISGRLLRPFATKTSLQHIPTSPENSTSINQESTHLHLSTPLFNSNPTNLPTNLFTSSPHIPSPLTHQLPISPALPAPGWRQDTLPQATAPPRVAQRVAVRHPALRGLVSWK